MTFVKTVICTVWYLFCRSTKFLINRLLVTGL